MQLSFYRDKLAEQGIKTLIPDETAIEMVNDTIYNEFSKNIFRPEVKTAYIGLIEQMKTRGAQGAILGCTEIPVLIKQQDVSIPVFDTTRLHTEAAVDFALSGSV
jgi:aspartate racemase